MDPATPLPTGTVTFLFTDIEGSVRLWEQHPDAMRQALARHDLLLRHAIEAHGGQVFKTVGDAFCAAFSTPPAAVAAALEAQRALLSEPWEETGPLRVRLALHTGVPDVHGGDYFGAPLNRVARLLAAGHGGQVLLSAATQELVRDRLPEGVTLRDLGEYRLRDLARPERVFQLVHADIPAEFPPLRGLDAGPHNLPVQRTPLIGREKEIAAVRQLLLRTDTGLVTLTGPGGTGKTRLALHVGADLLDDFSDGVFFVDLAPIRDPGLVASAIAQTLGVREAGGQPLVETVRAFLREKSLLLVVDNFEQVVAAAPLVADLLATAPRLKVLVTSRGVLRLQGEQEFPVPPLALPDPQRLPPLEGLSQYGAVALFLQRARAVKPEFDLTPENALVVAEICHRLDGLPLAIELAAARIRLLPPQAIASRLGTGGEAAGGALKLLTGGARDRPARQQALRTAIAWSYDLLDAAEKTLFRRLTVFVGGCTLEAAEAVCSADGDREIDLLDAAASLVEKSLLRQDERLAGEPRLVMLETIREFGRECLIESGEEASLRHRHAEYVHRWVERAERELEGPDQAAWLDQLKVEHYNVQAMLEWCVLHPEKTDLGLRSAAGLVLYWDVHGHYTEGSGWLERLLGNSDHASREEHAKGLQAAGEFARLQGDNSRAVELASQSLALAREIGDNQVAARSLQILGNVTYIRGDVASARVLTAESLSIFRKLGDRQGAARSVHHLGVLALREGDYAEAGARFEESLAMHREQGNGQRIALNIFCLALVARGRGEYRAADACLRESMAIARGLGYQRLLVMGVEGFAAVLLGAAGRVREVMHLPPQPNEGALVADSLAAARAALGEEAFAAAWAEGRSLTLDEAVALALDETREG
jgi:predicted ATPase/class 3 adenylate cyclase